jgi:TM2 domain-containing membrane protein YozV
MPSDEGRELQERMRRVRKTREAVIRDASEKSYLERHTLPASQPKCSRTLYVVLALFLGWLGIHNFVAGRAGRGVIQVLLTLAAIPTVGASAVVLAIWLLLDICTVTTDGNGARMA